MDCCDIWKRKKIFKDEEDMPEGQCSRPSGFLRVCRMERYLQKRICSVKKQQVGEDYENILFLTTKEENRESMLGRSIRENINEVHSIVPDFCPSLYRKDRTCFLQSRKFVFSEEMIYDEVQDGKQDAIIYALLTV